MCGLTCAALNPRPIIFWQPSWMVWLSSLWREAIITIGMWTLSVYITYFSYGLPNKFQRYQWPSAQDNKSIEIFGFWLAICINHFCKLNYGNMKKLWRKKIHTFGKDFFITSTLGPISDYHNLIWKKCTSFHYCALEFLLIKEIDICLIVGATSEENKETIKMLLLKVVFQ